MVIISSVAFGHEVSESQKEWIRKFQTKVDRHIPDFDKILLNTDSEPKLEGGSGDALRRWLHLGKDINI